MPIRILPYEPSHEPAVAAFNAQARAHNAPFLLSSAATPAWLPRRPGRTLYREFFLAFDGDAVCGGFTLRRQEFWQDGKVRRMANFQGPLSMGLWDRRYMMVGVQMLRFALQEEPCLYALGMGGRGQPLPKLLAAAGWTISDTPFAFKIPHPAAFLCETPSLRSSPVKSIASTLLAVTGLGPLGIHFFQAVRTRSSPQDKYICERVETFGSWADTIWDAAKTRYRFTAIRDCENQNTLFGDGNKKNAILLCRDGYAEIGWAVVRSTPMKNDKHFGNLRVGSLIDCLALPGRESTVVQLATAWLCGCKSDLLVTNQSHPLWTAALRQNGFWFGPSNFLFATSPALGPLTDVHFTRADGDGPIHL